MRLILATLIALSLSTTALAYTKANKNMDLCKAATHAVERKFNIPANLLRAISLTESGRWIKEEKANIAWPWTVASGKAGDFFPTKTDAIRHVRKLQAQGIKNIDVGCMQINLRYHPEAFENLNEAFDPYKNTEYAGTFLSHLFKEEKSWTQAAGRYHSSEPTKNMYYREKVMGFWNYANNEANQDRQVAYQEKRAQKKNVQVAQIDNNRMATLNNAFQQRLSQQRKAMTRAEQMSSQVSQWRDNRRLSNFGQANIARQQALYRQKQKKMLTVPTPQRNGLQKSDFSARRSAQLDKWRRTKANPALFNKNKTTPSTLLD